MKSCPTCNRTYPDETLAFCLVDGSILSAPFDPAERRQRPATPDRSPVTEVLSPPTVRPDTPSGHQSTLYVAAPPQPPAFANQIRSHKIASDVAGPSILLRLTFVLRGLCAIGFGIFVMAALGFHGLGFPFIVYALMVGTVGIISGVKTYLDYRTGWLLFLEGVFNLGVAVALIIANRITVYSLIIPPGCMIVGAIFQIGGAVQLRKKIKGVWPLALSGATSFLFGAALFIVVVLVIYRWGP